MATKKEKFTTPLMIAVWPKLDEPDVYKPKKGPEKVRYVTDAKFLNDDDMKKVVEMIKGKAKELLPDVKKPKLPFKKETEKGEDGERRETGAILLTASSGVKYRPPLFDAKNNKLPESIALGGGSKIKLNLSINSYEISAENSGINLYINAVQVLDLVEKGTGKSPFEEAEEGFTFEEGDSASPFKGGDSDEDPLAF
jgi:hypothetical protein